MENLHSACQPDGACCIRCVVIICYCWQKICATYCVYFYLLRWLLRSDAFSLSDTHFSFCIYRSSVRIRRASGREKDGVWANGKPTVVSCGSITPAGICDASIRDRDSWAMENKWTSRKGSNKEIIMFWMNCLVKRNFEKIKNEICTWRWRRRSRTKKKRTLDDWWYVIRFKATQTHTHSSAHYILFSNKINKNKSLSSPVRHIRERLGSERHDTNNRQIQTIDEKRPAWPQWMVRGAWCVIRVAVNISVQRVPQLQAHAFSSSRLICFLGSRRTTKSEFSRAAAAHEINETKYQVYECIDLISRMAKDIWWWKYASPATNYVVTNATHCKYFYCLPFFSPQFRWCRHRITFSFMFHWQSTNS